jgi:predicted RNA-binding Zn-ribbon protein involved in translation (DUF1610 family)
MAAMNISSRTANDLVSNVAKDFPQFKFRPGDQEHWSSSTKTITFSQTEPFEELSYGLLHELAHALLGHRDYHSDFELLKLESEAWELATEIGRKYRIKLDEDHIQDCLDTYRDWLHRRSTCPTCGVHVLQQNETTYKCFNCGTSWQVSHRRFARPYRRKIDS